MHQRAEENIGKEQLDNITELSELTDKLSSLHFFSDAIKEGLICYDGRLLVKNDLKHGYNFTKLSKILGKHKFKELLSNFSDLIQKEIYTELANTDLELKKFKIQKD